MIFLQHSTSLLSIYEYSVRGQLVLELRPFSGTAKQIDKQYDIFQITKEHYNMELWDTDENFLVNMTKVILV